MKVICPCCDGDGIETCWNPDHGCYGANGCPCCGNSEDHKMKSYSSITKEYTYNTCEVCNGTGECEDYEAEQFCEDVGIEYIPQPIINDTYSIF